MYTMYTMNTYTIYRLLYNYAQHTEEGRPTVRDVRAEAWFFIYAMFSSEIFSHTWFSFMQFFLKDFFPHVFCDRDIILNLFYSQKGGMLL